MAKYQLSVKAVEDLSGIWDYTYETWSEARADKYYRMLLDACEQLAHKPEKGKKYDEVYPDILGYKAGEHIIFYQAVSATGIEVVRILHSRMDIKTRMSE